MKIIAVTNQKGGTGKTTVAVHLAHWLGMRGKRAVLADCDAQQSATRWFGQGDGFHYENIAVRENLVELEPFLSGIDYLVIDTPPSITAKMGRQAIKVADMVVMPFSPSPLDVFASRGTIESAALHGKRPVVLVNRFGRSKVIARAMVKAVENLPVTLNKYPIGARVAFEEAPALGNTVFAEPQSTAAFELNRAFTEAMKFMP